MTEHRPTVVLQADVFPSGEGLSGDEAALVTYTPEEVAAEAWDNIREWMDNGYLPIVEVFMPDGTQHTVDLDRVRKGSQ
jgi:hypothetical protein